MVQGHTGRWQSMPGQLGPGFLVPLSLCVLSSLRPIPAPRMWGEPLVPFPGLEGPHPFSPFPAGDIGPSASCLSPSTECTPSLALPPPTFLFLKFTWLFPPEPWQGNTLLPPTPPCWGPLPNSLVLAFPYSSSDSPEDLPRYSPPSPHAS